MGCFGKKNMFSCVVGCQPDVPAAVAAYCTYTGRLVFNTLGSITDWIAWLGFEEAACVHQCYIDLSARSLLERSASAGRARLACVSVSLKRSPGRALGLTGGLMPVARTEA